MNTERSRKEELYSLMGRLPSRTRDVSAVKLWEEERANDWNHRRIWTRAADHKTEEDQYER
ncbi:hypothetical protein [Paenibacillus sp. GP183]|uniref:hypothetical protein n=1 Tax=Paenibacillus sp. GP183 TaxID=1882751 RepID=UPI000B87B175|nr:hypothetical protein [Paenibacillus sp. GP183]